MKQLPTMRSVRCPRGLTKKEQKVLRSLMRRKFYDLNHPEEGRRYPILLRAFLPADHRGNPCVILACQYTKPDRRGNFDYVIFSDGLYGKGHYASDSHGNGNMSTLRASFEEHLAGESIGVWPWVIEEVLKDAKALAKVAS